MLFQNGHLHQGFLEHERHQHGHGAYGPPKPPPTQVIIHSSLKYSFLPEELGNKQTHKLTYWHPIAFIEWFIYLLVFFSCFISWKYYVFRIINSLISTFCMNVAWFLEDRLRMQKFQHFALPKKNWVNTNLGNRNIS